MTKRTRTVGVALAPWMLVAWAGAQPAGEPPAKVRYDGQKTVRVTVETARQLATVRALSEEVLNCGLEGPIVGTFDIRIKPEQFLALQGSDVPHQVLIDDIQAYNEMIAAQEDAVRATDGSFYATYRNLDEIEARIASLVAANPTLARLSQIGQSVQGRPLRLVRITGPGTPAEQNARTAIVVICNQHAREWKTPLAGTYIVEQLLSLYASDPQVQQLVNSIDLYLVPSVNPDGFVYSRTVEALWRKNRRDNPATTCDGVDLNRNWSHLWGLDNVGSSPSPCSETYRGAAGPLSEPELQQIDVLVRQLRDQRRLAMFWDVHSFGQLILYPWGYTAQPARDVAEHARLSTITQNAIRTVRNRTWTAAPGSTGLYFTNGTANDYGYAVGRAMSWTIEIGQAFQPPVTEIQPVISEVWAGFLATARDIATRPRYCYANCDNSTTAPALNPLDFQCFVDRLVAGNIRANCDESTTPPVLNVVDFQCFLGEYRRGCP